MESFNKSKRFNNSNNKNGGALIRRLAAAAFAALCLAACTLGAFRVSVTLTNGAAGAARVPLILIDAGHGGEDGGASGVGGLVEKELNLDIALRLRDALRLMGFRVRMTRETDVSLHTGEGKRKRSDLQTRLDAINADGVDLCVSVHQNSYAGRGTARGAQVFCAPNGEKSRAFAESVRESLSRLRSENERAVKVAGSSVFILNNAKNPAVLVECGFLSDPVDALLLSKQSERAGIAFAIARGVAEGFFNETNG